jgi:cell wall-associated NlpC family hydrolase
MLTLPLSFLRVPYVAARYPGAPGVRGLEGGANCQQFAYELLRHFGRRIGDFRSRELWLDTEETVRVSLEALEPLDLLLFNRTQEPYGAHVAVYVGEGQVVHLCKEVGRPVVWNLEEFARRPQYRTLVGAKRVNDPCLKQTRYSSTSTPS